MSSQTGSPNPSPPPSRRKKGRRSQLFKFILIVGVLLAATTLIEGAYRFVAAPWSLSLGGRPTMTGAWSGPVTLDNGLSGTLVLTLEDLIGQQESWYEPLINGSAHYCLGNKTGDFEVYGKADRQGNISDLRFRPVVDDPIWLLNMMSSQWHGDTLVLSGVYSYDPTAVHIARSDVPEPPINMTLRPVTAESNCLVDAP